MLLLLIALATIVIVGVVAIALAEPHATYENIAWNDEAERRLLRERKIASGWW